MRSSAAPYAPNETMATGKAAMRLAVATIIAQQRERKRGLVRAPKFSVQDARAEAGFPVAIAARSVGGRIRLRRNVRTEIGKWKLEIGK